MRRLWLWIAMLVMAVLFAQQSAWAAKNVILMISDGAGHNQWLAASMYQGKLGRQVYDQPGWKRCAAATYPLNLFVNPTGNMKQVPWLVYDPAKAWDAAPQGDKPGLFAGYVFLTTTPTDSAAAATALSSGQKTYNNAINWTNDGHAMRGQSVAEIAKSHGKSVGTISSAPWSHATPAGLGGAHNISRNHYAEIANEMLEANWLDVIMGAGHPDFDDDGRPLSAAQKRDYKYVGGQDAWTALKSGKRPWKLVEKKADFEALVSGPTPPKVLGTAQGASTLQAKRAQKPTATPYDQITAAPSAEELERLPFQVPLNKNVPTLAVMARAAINCLDDNPKGFFLHIEGGAVDWACHANQPDRMIEEQIGFVEAVEAVVAWIESHGGWDDTLLILVADHETGLIWGPECDKYAFQPLEDRGAGKLPGMKFLSHGHSNSLVPVYARGPGSERFDALAKGTDAKAAEVWQFSGRYVENTDIPAVMRSELAPSTSKKTDKNVR